MNTTNFLFREALDALNDANTDLWLAAKEMEEAARIRIRPGEEDQLFAFRQIQSRAERGFRAAYHAKRAKDIYTQT